MEIFGYAVGIAGNDSGTAFAPLFLQKSKILSTIPQELHWNAIFYVKQSPPGLAAIPSIAEVTTKLAEGVFKCVKKKSKFLVFGGDHSSGIGTWSGASDALYRQGDLGLIWLDAHMDGHSPATTPSGNVHGMSLAVLLGHGDNMLTSVSSLRQKIKPENLCIVGVRSYEPLEYEFLKKLGVKIFFMEEVLARGFKAVLNEAIEIVSKHTVGFGVSIDMDLFDPEDAPGVGMPEEAGLSKSDFFKGWKPLAQNAQFIGLEIVEFNPMADKKEKTEQFIAEIVQNTFV